MDRPQYCSSYHRGRCCTGVSDVSDPLPRVLTGGGEKVRGSVSMDGVRGSVSTYTGSVTVDTSFEQVLSRPL
jgi:hypothetical protein